MATWLKDTFLDFFIGGHYSEDPLPSLRAKRRPSTDGRGHAKARRYSASAYRDAPYELAGPSRNRRDSIEAIRARRSLEDLRRNWPSDPGAQVFGHFEQLRDHLDSDIRNPVGRLSLTGLDEELWTPSGSDGIFSGDEDWLPEVATDLDDGSVGWESDAKSHPTKIERCLRRPSKQAALQAAKTARKSSVASSSGAPRRPSVIPSSSCAPVVEEPWTTGADIPEVWSTKPNGRAREILQSHPLTAKKAIQREIQEPEYALRDVEVRDGLWKLMDMMERMAKDFFNFGIRQPELKEQVLRKCFKSLSPQTAKIIGCVASGGPGSVEGWENLFANQNIRPALVLAIIGNVLVEQVFQHLFFGGSKEQIDVLAKMQEAHKDEDGFDRNTHYATYIRTILSPSPHTTTHTLPPNFSNHVNLITSVLWTHLTPIFAMRPTTNRPEPLAALKSIVTLAGLLSLSMRMDAHTVYYFEPVFKEDTFNGKRMACYNQHTMQQTNPRTPDDEPLLSLGQREQRAKIPAAEKQRARNDDPLTQITIMDGVTAYRLGGWESAQSTQAHRQYERFEDGDKGMRSRIVTYGWVYCRWGRARKFKDGKAADVPEAHGPAWKGGFREFTDVEGVPDWLGMERAEREALREGVVGGYEAGGRSSGDVKGKGRAVEVEEGVEDEDDVEAQLRRESGL